MNLFKTFPEIDNFFVSNKFTDAELNNFLKEIEKKYIDKDLRKAALNLINLELAKFQIVKDKIDLDLLRKASKNKNTKANPTEEIQEIKQLNIQMIAEKLRWRVERVLNFLSQKGLQKTAGEVLNGDEFNNVKEMIISRIKAVQRMDKQQELESRGTIKNKKSEKSLNPRNDVYSRIEEIGLGKIIYIRKS